MPTSAPAAPWFVCVQPQAQARVRLFCFHYSGGSAAVFAQWPRWLPPEIEVWAAQLPGRGKRLGEPPIAELPRLIQALTRAIVPHLDWPYVFFGHSMGALLAFELARALRRSHGRTPHHLIVSAHRAPQLPDPDPPIHALPEAEFIDQLRRLNGTPAEVLAHDELLQLFLPSLRADFALCETYTYTRDEQLHLPIAAFGGLQDRDVDHNQLLAWHEQTAGAFTLQMFPGDHFFLKTEQFLLLATLARELRHLLEL